MRVPSGDQRGAVSFVVPVVSGRGGVLPSVGTIQMREVYLPPVSASAVVTTYATREPSGAGCGSPTDWRS